MQYEDGVLSTNLTKSTIVPYAEAHFVSACCLLAASFRQLVLRVSFAEHAIWW